MSSNPPPERQHTQRSRSGRPLTLRSKLIIGIVALIIAVCAVVAVTTGVFLNRYLVGQVDKEVTQQQSFAKGGPDRQRDDFLVGGGLSCRTNGQYGPGPNLNSLSAIVADGQVIASTMPAATGSTYSCPPVPESSEAQLVAVPADGRLHTVTVDGVGDYRVAATSLSNGTTLINGMSLAPAHALLVQLGIIMAIVTGIALLAGGFAVFWIVRRSLRPLDRVVATARQVSTLPLDRGEVDLGVRVPERDTDTRTEIGQVGAAVNQMLGHVSRALVARQASEMRVRQFVADASHELRTPLAAIRGYAELARREEDDTEGVAHALRRVESESARMTTLVDDLLLLARLDSGRPLSAEEVDLTLVVVDAVSDARVAGPSHRWQLFFFNDPATT